MNTHERIFIIMKIKRILALFLSMMLMLSVITIPVCASDIVPYWNNTSTVAIVHGYISGKAGCSVTIEGFKGTDKIDNVTITLSKVVGDDLIEIKTWTGLPAKGDTFRFYGEAEGVTSGSKYRLAVKADVYRNGTVESLDEYGERIY